MCRYGSEPYPELQADERGAVDTAQADPCPFDASGRSDSPGVGVQPGPPSEASGTDVGIRPSTDTQAGRRTALC
jgi:hypothetical protein